MLELTAENCAAYAAARGLAEPGARAESLGGGVSNGVFRVGALVFKQALPRLRVRDEWLADVDRIFVEADAADLTADLLPGQAPCCRYRDRENCIIAIDLVPGAPWKSALLAGEVDLLTAARVGQLLGNLHRETGRLPQVALRFDDRRPFHQLRVSPYLETVAARHPDLAGAIGAITVRLLAHREALVHGDYSPKNILVPGPVLLDFEVAHWGDPAFDAAFCLNHLCLKAAKFPARRAQYLAGARRFLAAYLKTYGPYARPTLERDTVHLLGALLLARVDGKSPAEYLTAPAEQERVRRAGRSLVQAPAATLAEALARLEVEIDADCAD